MIEQEVLTALSGHTDAGTRVHALFLPQGSTYPAIVFQRISNTPVDAINGSSGLDHVRVQIDVYSPSFLAAKTVLSQVRPLMLAAGFTGLMVNDFDEYEAETKLYRSSADYMCWD
jgi:hypothetical protein